jgi:hypothetical protein
MASLLQSHFTHCFCELGLFSLPFFFSFQSLARIRRFTLSSPFFWVDYWDDGLVELCPRLFCQAFGFKVFVVLVNENNPT